MKIICIGRNYVAHAAELNNEVPDQPVVFMKPATALLINEKPLYYPEFTQDLHYEIEMVVKISKNGRYVQPEFASEYYDEVSLGIDFTARDLQSRCKDKSHPWEIAKAFDNSAALGEWQPIAKDIQDLRFSLKKNGETVQEGYTANMIFPVDDIIVYVSQFFKLQMGDIIYTGTPEGVGPVQIDDVLEGFLEGKKVLHTEIK
ncbi:MAG: fumarylacetoacetate hydrolase family protein [Saprospiraceae bacterium]|nr:fumarylacetoacetate hydrolase family protein [Saprospiraceae bacterium]